MDQFREIQVGQSASGLIRDCKGTWIVFFLFPLSLSKKFGLIQSMVAELWGLRDGLVPANNLQCPQFIHKDRYKVFHWHNNILRDSSHAFNSLIFYCRSPF